MTAFKQIWDAQRSQRQQATAQRQEDVAETLMAFHQKRQKVAAQLRTELSAFQKNLQQDTQTFLDNTTRQRQTAAQQVMQQLQVFQAQLQSQTEQFLAVTTAERSLMAQQLTQELTQHRAALTTSVTQLRTAIQQEMQELQTEVRSLQSSTQSTLQDHHQARIQSRLVLAAELTAFVEALSVDVQNYLMELEQQRQQRAESLNVMLQQSRDQRLAAVESMFSEFAAFRAALQAFCGELRSQVWGEMLPIPSAFTAVASVPVAPANTSVATKPAVEKPSPVTASPAVEKSPSAPVAPPKATADQPATAPLVVPTPKQAENSPTASPATKSPQHDATQIEKDIYSYIHTSKGARLTEIESALGINRFQAVDALRALIRKSLITQRDRIYLIQEELPQ